MAPEKIDAKSLSVINGNGCPAYVCAVLAGGKGSRLGGIDKSQLKAGEQTFLERITEELKRLGTPCYLSAAAYPHVSGGGLEVITDYPLNVNASGGQIGPLGGMLSCLEETGADCIFFVPCDMPGFRAEMASLLAAGAEDDSWDCLLWQTRDGRIHPACGFYMKRCIPAMKEAIKAGNYRLRDLCSLLKCRIVRTAEMHIPDCWFRNINDEASFKAYTEARQKHVIFAVSGKKNTGKTTLLEKLVEELSARGIRTAVIKHDGHDFEPDVPGTDSWRLKKAGAYGTVIFSGERYCVVKDQRDMKTEDFLLFFPEADLILLEGHKSTPWRKLELLRKEVSALPVCDPDTVVVYAADWIEAGNTGVINGRPVISRDDTETMLEIIINEMDI